VGRPPEHLTRRPAAADVVLECGWGRLLFGQTFPTTTVWSPTCCAARSRAARHLPVRARPPRAGEPRPQELFIDPSHTYRLWLHRYRPRREPDPRRRRPDLASRADADAVNRIYTAAGMVTAPTDVHVGQPAHPDLHLPRRRGRRHRRGDRHRHRRRPRHAFNDPEDGTSLWCLAVDPQTLASRRGRGAGPHLAERFQARGRAYLDLSVVHDNEPAIALYEKLGFERVPVFCVKRKNPINERLFAAARRGLDDLNPYARIIADEALRRASPSRSSTPRPGC
jgi:ribosomal protein S18 acetylase RimI-like enzyme